MSDPLRHIAIELRETAAEAVGRHLSERALLRPTPDDEATAHGVLMDEVKAANRERVRNGAKPLTHEEIQAVAILLYDSLFRLGPLQEFLDDPDVEELIVNGSAKGFVIRSGGRKEEIDTGLTDDDELRALMVRTAARVGRRLDEGSPAVDVQLPSGRLHALLPPLAPFPCLTIRRHRLVAEDLGELIRLGTLTQAAARFIASSVQGGLNILVAGGTASGKTTTLHVLGREIPSWERVVTIEETAELELDKFLPDCVALEARFANVEGIGGIKIRDLLRHALRMRPTRIIVGEVRGPEAIDMLAAMNSGHEGSMGTIHASSARQALSKLEMYVLMGEERLDGEVASRMISETIDLVVQLQLEHASGRRQVESIVEVAGMEMGRVLCNEVFRRESSGLVWTGLRPRCADRLEARGLPLGWTELREAT